MIVIGYVEKIVPRQVNIHKGLSFFIGEPTSDACVKQRIPGRGGLRVICQEGPVLGGIIFELYFDEGMHQVGPVRGEFISQLGDPVRGRDKGQVFGAVAHGLALRAFIGPVDDGKTVLEMERLYGMDVDAELAAVQLGFGGNELEIGVAAVIHGVRTIFLCQLFIIDIVRDKIIEEVQGGHYIMRGIDKADIFL